MNKPRIMIAAPRSGSGKTTITCGLIRALTNRALNIHAFKCGPDYIDPMFHRSVLGIPSKNLDLFFTNPRTTRELFFDGNDSELSVIEGVMGLYDGIGGISTDASSYHLATVLRAPVVLVVDAHGMGKSVIAEIKGFLSMDDERLIKAVILNRITGSFYESIKPVIEDELGIRVIGYFPKTDKIKLESRHLGLILPSETKKTNEILDNAADITERYIDIDAFLSIANEAENIDFQDKSVKRIAEPFQYQYEYAQKIVRIDSGYPLRVAIADDEAFCFYYEDNIRMLKCAGIEPVSFSPIHDKKLPEGIAGLILGGGYPENYLSELSDNKDMLYAIREAIDSGMPSLAECGGFMYLHEYIKDMNGEEYSLVGALPGICEYRNKLVRFGYLQIEEKTPVFMDSSGSFAIKGHEFHYYDSTNNGCDCISIKPTGNRSWESAHVTDNHWWGFAHLYYPSNPEFVTAFVNRLVSYFRENYGK